MILKKLKNQCRKQLSHHLFLFGELNIFNRWLISCLRKHYTHIYLDIYIKNLKQCCTEVRKLTMGKNFNNARADTRKFNWIFYSRRLPCCGESHKGKRNRIVKENMKEIFTLANQTRSKITCSVMKYSSIYRKWNNWNCHWKIMSRSEERF